MLKVLPTAADHLLAVKLAVGRFFVFLNIQKQKLYIQIETHEFNIQK